jgi:hypothetical protein
MGKVFLMIMVISIAALIALSAWLIFLRRGLCPAVRNRTRLDAQRIPQDRHF